MRFSKALLAMVLGITTWVGMSSFVNVSAAADGDPYVAHYMWRRYFNVTTNCPTDGTTPNAATAPEFVCTGIIFRATSPTKEPDGGWVPEAKSYPNAGGISAGGVSFSYIRADSKFDRAAFHMTNGFTIFPNEGKYKYNGPLTKESLWVMCAFAIDGGTDSRHDAGCGATKNGTGGQCQANHITLQAWEKSFDTLGASPTADALSKWSYNTQCGWSMERGVRQPSDFTNVIKAKQHTKTFDSVNELRIKTWANSISEATSADTANKLPIESFFYFSGNGVDSKTGLSNARYDQRKYYAVTKKWVPIVLITLPASPSADFDFHYNKSDQDPTVPIPVFKKSDDIPCTKGKFDTVC